jgi:pimeloyl-ACP methyl ester carboxylesterase
LMPSFFMNQIVEGMITGVRSPERREEIRKELRGGDPATIMQAARAVIRFSSHDWASDITVPTAVIVTTKDTLVAPDRQFSLAASIPDAKLWKIDADHLACVNATDQFVPALLAACEYVHSEADRSVAALA